MGYELTSERIWSVEIAHYMDILKIFSIFNMVTCIKNGNIISIIYQGK